METVEFEKREQVQYYCICKGNLPIFETVKHRTCESEVLLNPTAGVFRSCNIKISYNISPWWTAIQSLYAWLHSTAEKVQAEVICPSKSKSRIGMIGIGLIQMVNECELRTDDVTLPCISNLRGLTEIIYECTYNLELPNISNITLTYQNTKETELNWRSFDPHFMNMKDFELKETSLDQIEQQLNEITFQRQNHSKQINLIHGSYIGLRIISISLVVYLC